jgi:tRNA (cytosine38-C5)-methyltransferase
MKPIVKTIERLTPEYIDAFDANAWTLSPPCQPYTHGGKQLDDKDTRTRPLLHLIDLLKQIKTVPDYLFLENVPNFEKYMSRKRLVETLDELGFEMKEFLVTPTQFGIPNHRRRYYLAARRLSGKTEGAPYVENAQILSCPGLELERTSEANDCPPLSDYLEKDLQDEHLYKVPDQFILKAKNFKFDIVRPSYQISSCITKGYGSHHIFGSGSMLQTTNFEESEHDFDYSNNTMFLDLGLRFFTPTEVARLQAFPIDSKSNMIGHSFSFPPGLTVRQQWKLLGNSLNCHVVAMLMKHYVFK